MNDKSVIIIGAGLAGLATGCYARMNGYRTKIFEQHTAPGGVCTAWQRQGYTIDGDIEWLMGCQPGSNYFYLYQELGVTRDCRLLPLQEFCSFLDEKTGHSIRVTSDLDRLATDMKAIAPADVDIVLTNYTARTMSRYTGLRRGLPTEDSRPLAAATTPKISHRRHSCERFAPSTPFGKTVPFLPGSIASPSTWPTIT